MKRWYRVCGVGWSQGAESQWVSLPAELFASQLTPGRSILPMCENGTWHSTRLVLALVVRGFFSVVVVLVVLVLVVVLASHGSSSTGTSSDEYRARHSSSVAPWAASVPHSA
eukprot:3512362-Rhodomonas_salina.3